MSLRNVLIGASVLLAGACAATLAMASKRIAAEQAAFDAPAQPTCTPALLNRSDLLPGTSLAVSPLPDSYDASTRTQISLLGVPSAAISDVSVSGSQSGAHGGRLEAYSQGDGDSFLPASPFLTGETVTVRGKLATAKGEQPFAFRFTVARQDPIDGVAAASAPLPRDYNEEQHFHSRPELQPPVLVVTTDDAGTTPGDLFAAPYAGPGPSGPMIFEESGKLVWFHPLPKGTESTNLQVQQYDGQQVLTWWQGHIPPQGFGQGEEIIDNSSYQQIARVQAGNGYVADLHEFHITPQGTALLSVFDPIYCNLSALGGPSGGAVTNTIFQEIDLATGLVRREWTALDHVSLDESQSSAATSSTAWPFDYFHLNSIDQLAGGTTLISARNTSTLYELNTSTGQVVTQIGGKNSTLKLAAGAATAYQHDASVLANGTISVFDNGGVPKVHSQSRGLVLAVEAKTKSVRVVSEYDHAAPALLSGSQGNLQTLADGNVFIGWGAEPYFSEYTAAGKLLYDAHLHGSYQSYRSYRFEWTGAPTEAPALALSPSGANTVVYASWNGDTRTASWQVLAGPSPGQLSPVASAPRSGFETAITAPGAYPYIAVQALAADGAVLGSSRVISG